MFKPASSEVGGEVSGAASRGAADWGKRECRREGDAVVSTFSSSSGEATVEVAARPELAYSAPAVAAQPIPRRQSWRVRLLLVHSDIFALLLSFFVAERLFNPVVDASGGISLRGAVFLLTLPGWIAGLKLLGLYDRDDELIHHSTLDEIPRLFQLATMGVWGYVAIAWSMGVDDAPFATVLTFWALLVLFLPLMRVLIRAHVHGQPDFPQNTVIVGAGSVGQLLARKLLQHPEYHVNLLGFVDDHPRERREDLDDLNLLGAPDDLAELVGRLDVERVIIAFSNESTEQTMDLIRALKDHPVRIDIVPRLFDIIPPRLTSHTVEGIPLLTLPRLRLSPWRRFLKRSLDLVVAVSAIIFLAPVLAVAAILIKLDSRGPVFFRQQRMGGGEQPFYLLKFRTMDSDAEKRKPELEHLNKHAQPGGDPRMFKIRRDPRVTRVGRVLRRYSLDELPQLLNVLKGEMSLIGPRPLILEEDRHVEAWGRRRLSLKPGMTGLWQVLGRSAIPFEEMVKLDYLYVTTWSLVGDIRLLLQTVPVIFRGERDGAN
jgi:exopolysaccharide biosynthesis polyprenyl glycosylphosphotransferase